MEKNPWTQRQATSEGQPELNENNVQDLWHKNHKSKSSGHWHLEGKRERGKKKSIEKVITRKLYKFGQRHSYPGI